MKLEDVTYSAHIKITKGFYRGHRGLVISRSKNWFSGKWTAKIQINRDNFQKIPIEWIELYQSWEG